MRCNYVEFLTNYNWTKSKGLTTTTITQNYVINYNQLTHNKTLNTYEKPQEHQMKHKNTRSGGKTRGAAPLVST